MFSTLDTQPQEWMQGDPEAFHTVAACHFESESHAEYWINRLIPKNRNGRHLKWSEGKRNKQKRDEFIQKCLDHSKEIDFKVNCVSTPEGHMSWFAWVLYIQNRELISLHPDGKSRNCLKFAVSSDNSVSMPVLRAGHLIWYSEVILYLEHVKKIEGNLLSDNFAGDGLEANGTAFLNFLLLQKQSRLRVSLALNERYKALDKLSDYFCGWCNSTFLTTSQKEHRDAFKILRDQEQSFLNAITLMPSLNILDENGKNITQQVMEFAASAAT